MNLALASVHEALNNAERALREAGVPAARREAETLLAAILECPTLAVYLATEFTAAHAAQFDAWITARAQGAPTQYLTGRVRFYDHEFLVTPATLIPRPETELLVKAALRYAHRLAASAPQLRLVDVGTGSGAIAVSLTKRLSSSKMVAIDRSYAALVVAAQNAARLGVAERIAFLQGDGMTGLATSFSPHIIVANPPYIPTDELSQLPPDVQQEPRIALDGGPDGCAQIARWLREAGERLAPCGVVLMEIGAGQDVRALVAATHRLRVVDIQPDWHGIPRMLIAERIAVDG